MRHYFAHDAYRVSAGDASSIRPLGIVNHNKPAIRLSFSLSLNQKTIPSSRHRDARIIPHLYQRNSAWLRIV
jgi:hypothetical protein